MFNRGAKVYIGPVYKGMGPQWPKVSSEIFERWPVGWYLIEESERRIEISYEDGSWWLRSDIPIGYFFHKTLRSVGEIALGIDAYVEPGALFYEPTCVRMIIRRFLVHPDASALCGKILRRSLTPEELLGTGLLAPQLDSDLRFDIFDMGLPTKEPPEVPSPLMSFIYFARRALDRLLRFLLP